MEITREQALALHRALWDWLAQEDGRRKEEWPLWEFNGGWIPEMAESCPMCEYVNSVDGGCDDCLLEWPNGKCIRDGDNKGLYDKWLLSDFSKKIAAKIRDLPIKDRWEYLPYCSCPYCGAERVPRKAKELKYQRTCRPHEARQDL